MNDQAKGLTAIFFAACIWGLTGPYFRWLDANHIDIFTSNAVSGFTAGIVIWIYIRARRFPMPGPNRRQLIAFAAHMFGALITALTMFNAFRLTSVANTVLLHYLTPVFVAVVSVPLFGERMSLSKVAALLLSMFGMSLVVASRGDSLNLTVGQGELLAFASSLSYTVSVIAGKYLQDFPSHMTAMLANLLIAVASTAIAILGHAHLPSPANLGIMAIAGGVFGGTVSMYLYFYALSKADASRVSIVALWEIVVAAFLGGILFNERLTIWMVLGGALIAAGGVMVASKKAG